MMQKSMGKKYQPIVQREEKLRFQHTPRQNSSVNARSWQLCPALVAMSVRPAPSAGGNFSRPAPASLTDVAKWLHAPDKS